jgi:N utilization substance protein B
VDDTSDAIACNEAVELAKLYGEEKAPSFVNGILGNLVRSREADA